MRGRRRGGRGGGGGGGISLLSNQDEPIFRGYILPDQPEFLVIFYKLFQFRQTQSLGLPLFYWPWLGGVKSVHLILAQSGTSIEFRLSSF